MMIADILTSPWVIRPEKLAEIQEVYQTHLRGDKIDLSVIEASLGRRLKNEPQPYQVFNGVAVIEANGIMAKRMSLFHDISGGVSTYFVGQQFAEALADRRVKAIMLNIDSPGGSVDGTQELAGMIHSARGVKPVVAWSDGMMASAAYWIASAADRVYISGNTVDVGSIGVVAIHRDFSKAYEDMGVKTTEITAGKYKRIASEYSPLSKDGRAYIQDQVDHIYSVFVDDVAKHRGVSSEEVLSRMADGRVFIGNRAVAAGLVDGVKTFDEVIHLLSSGDIPGSDTADGASAEGSLSGRSDSAGKVIDADPGADPLTWNNIQPQEGVITMKVSILGKEVEVQDGMVIDTAWVKGNCPDAVQSIQEEGASGERARVSAIDEVAVHGYEDIVNQAKADGKSTAQDVAVRIAKAEKGRGAEELSKIQTEGVKPIPGVSVEGVHRAEGEDEPTFEGEVAKYQKEHGCKRGDAIRAVVAANPELHEKFVASQPVITG